MLRNTLLQCNKFYACIAGVLSVNAYASTISPGLLKTALNQAEQVNSLEVLLQPSNACSPRKGPSDSKPIVLADGGGSTSGNAHAPNPPGPACFTGKSEAVKACIVAISKDFGISEKDAVRDIQQAYRTWGQYVENSGLQHDSHYPDFAKDIQVSSKCDGSENLKIYLGTSDRAVDELRSRYPNPWGFLSCNPPASDGSWSKGGVLWITSSHTMGNNVPNWKIKNHFYAIALRELGWAFGNGPTPGTILRDDFTSFLSGEGDPNSVERLMDRQSALPNIDQERTLLLGDRNETVTMEMKNILPEKSDISRSFERLMGRPPHGEFSETMEVQKQRNAFSITLRDKLGSRTFQLDLQQVGSCELEGSFNFWRVDKKGTGKIALGSQSCTMAGRIRGQKPPGFSKKADFPIVMYLNGKTAKYEVYFQDYKLSPSSPGKIFVYLPYWDSSLR